MSSGVIALIVFGCLFGACGMCSAIGSRKGTAPVAASAKSDPSAEAARVAAQAKAAEEARAAKEKTAVETFPAKKGEIAASLTKAKAAADASKWSQANDELTPVEAALAGFQGTSVAEQKEFEDLEDRATALRKRIQPPIEKAAKAAAAASAEAALKASAIVVTNAQLFNDYQANEVAADARYKGNKLLVTGSVASVDKGPLGGLYLRLATSNEFMSTMCDMEKSEQADMAQLRKGEQVRVLCTGGGMTVGSPSLRDCVFR